VQSRTQLDQGVIDEYAEAMAAGVEFPLVIVFTDGTVTWLADGFHRVAAAGKAERDSIDADVRPGTKRDAILFACGANTSHGLRRSNSDKRRAVTLLLGDAEWSAWSDREIARRAGVNHELVGTVRVELSGGNRQMKKRKVQRGKSTFEMKSKQRKPKQGAEKTEKEGWTVEVVQSGGEAQGGAVAVPQPVVGGSDVPVAVADLTVQSQQPTGVEEQRAVEEPVVEAKASVVKPTVPPVEDPLRLMVQVMQKCPSDMARKLLAKLASSANLDIWVADDDPAESLRELGVHVRQQLRSLAAQEVEAAERWVESMAEEMNGIIGEHREAEQDEG